LQSASEIRWTGCRRLERTRASLADFDSISFYGGHLRFCPMRRGTLEEGTRVQAHLKIKGEPSSFASAAREGTLPSDTITEPTVTGDPVEVVVRWFLAARTDCL